MNKIITNLENRFESLKENFISNKVILIFAIQEAENILREANEILDGLNKISNDKDDVKLRVTALINQTNEMLDFLKELCNSREMNL